MRLTCGLALAQRVETKLSGSKVEQVINRVRVAEPTARDSRSRGVSIPQSVLAAKAAGNAGAPAAGSATDLPSVVPKRRTQLDEQEEQVTNPDESRASARRPRSCYVLLPSPLAPVTVAHRYTPSHHTVTQTPPHTLHTATYAT